MPIENLLINQEQTQPNNLQHPTETESNNEKIPPPLFVINITNYVKLQAEISSILHSDFSATNKNNKIKINVETIDGFKTITKFFEEKSTNTSRTASKAKRISQPSFINYQCQSRNPKSMKN